MITRTCLCLIIRMADGRREVLLGRKKTGFGAGKWVGLGGHVEEGEKPLTAAVREVEEESGLIVRPDELTHMATITFLFPARPDWDQSAEVFATAAYQGEPAESDEIAPQWFGVDDLPLDGMWDDARYWLPPVLAGRHVIAEVIFADDCETVSRIEPDSYILTSS